MIKELAKRIGEYRLKTALFPMGLAAPAGSLLSVVICLIAYAVLYHKEKERLLNGKAFANR